MGKRVVVLAVLGALASNAFAADEVVKLSDGYELVSGQRSIDVRKGKRRARLFPGYAFDVKARVDAKAKKVTISRSEECRADLSDTLTFDQLEARLLNTEALVLHRNKDWANAAKIFAQATKLDPAYVLAAYNLASAHSQLGQLQEANAALAPWLESNPIATYIQVSVDPELQPLLATKELVAAKGTTKPGTIKVAESGAIDGKYAFSAERGWLAVPHSAAGYLECGGSESLTIFDVKSGKQVASIPLGSVPGGSDGPCRGTSRATIEKAKKARAESAKIAETILVGFGFAKIASESAGADEKDDESGKRVARFPVAKIGVVDHGGNVNVLRGNTSLGKGGTSNGGRFTRAAYLPDAKVVVVTSYVPSDTCARTDEDLIVITDPAPPAARPAKKP